MTLDQQMQEIERLLGDFKDAYGDFSRALRFKDLVLADQLEDQLLTAIRALAEPQSVWCACEPTRCEGNGKCRWLAMDYSPLDKKPKLEDNNQQGIEVERNECQASGGASGS